MSMPAIAALTRQLLAPVIRRFRQRESTLRSGYFASAPSAQNALDVFEGEWYTSLPGDFRGLRAGPIDLYNDPRLAWGLGEIGAARCRNVLELGPLEGAHTYMLEQAGCASITSIEGNPRAFLKCLVLKEVLGLQRSHFLCGDFVEYLRGVPSKADLVVASGVLYHMTNPVELIHLISRVTDCVFVWTHYYDESALANQPRIRRKLTSQIPSEYQGFRHVLFRYEYWGSFGLKRFCGGPNPHAFWMERAAILDCLRFFGFNSIVTNFDEPDHPDGPAFALVGRRQN
jgi:hypothetical protein